MNIELLIAELNKKYPGKSVFTHDETDAVEILCEVEPSSDHPEYSNAVAVIDRSIPHTHHKTTETYKVTKGSLVLHVGKESITLNEGESYVITPGNEHWAEGNETWIEAYSEPGWTFEDHVISKQEKK